MKEVWRAAAYFVGAVDLTGQTSRLHFEASVEEKECTTFGSGGAKEVVGGLEEGNVTFTFKNDYAAGALDDIMAGLVSRTPQTFAVRPNAANVSTSNPQYSGSILVNSWQPISGNVGDLPQVSRTYTKSGPIVRATST